MIVCVHEVLRHRLLFFGDVAVHGHAIQCLIETGFVGWVA
jgi:hypothetical protein